MAAPADALAAAPRAEVPRLPMSVRLGWGVGGLGSYTILSTSSLLVLFFMTTVLGIDPGLAGAAMLAAKLYDMAANPVVGVLSDRTRSPWGRRRPFLLAGGVVSAVALVLIFNLPVFATQWLTLAAVVGALMLLATGYTLFNVPYLSMPAEMTDDFHERTVLMSYRVFFVSLATIASTSAAPAIIEAAGGGRAGYAAMSWLVGGVCLVAVVACFLGTAGARATPRSTTRLGFAAQARLVLSNQPFRMFIAAKFLQLIGLSASTVALPFLMSVALGRGGYGLAAFGLASTIGTVCSMPVWVRLSKRYGKRDVYIASIVVFAVAKVSWVLATPHEAYAVFLLRAVVTGLSAGGMMLLGTSLLPDCAEYDYRRTGLRREGLYSGFYSFAEKTAFALGPLATGAVLQAAGFVNSTGGHVAQQPESAVHAVYVASSVVPALLPLLSIAFLWRYRLTQQQLQSMTPPAPSQVSQRSR
jgi:GPH family glycoside/pentoside/hexuronide:cation symporter